MERLHADTEQNGLGLTPAEARVRLEKLDRILTVLHDTPAVYPEWRRLIAEREVKGVPVHDARIAASMGVHKIGKILTYNPKDFLRYEGIVSVSPNDFGAEAGLC